MKHALLPAALLIAAGVLCTNCKTKMKISTLPYPVARMDSTVDDYFGTKVPDPYRWLEDDNSAETAAWVTAENEVTQNYLSQIPFRDKIRNRLTELWNYPKYGVPSKHGDYFFFFENDGLQNQSVLYRQKSLDGPAEVFLDPNKLSDDGTVALSDVSFSKDGKYCAYAAASSGSDWVEIRVMDVATRELLPDVIRWVKFSGAVWTRDGFYYSGYDEPKQSEALVAQNRFQKIFFHKLGTEQSADRLIYEDRAHPLRYVSAEVSKDDRHLFVFATEGTSGNEVLWADLSKGAPEFEVLFPGFANDYALVHARDGRAVFYTNEGAPRYRLVQADLNGAEPVLSELLPESELLLEGASERRVDVLVRILDEAEPPVEVQPPDRDFVRRRVDLQNDAPAFAEGREGLRTHVPAAQGGRYGEVFDIVPSVALPVVEDADELIAAPDAVGPEGRIPEGADVVLLGALLLVGERPAVNLHRFGPSPVGGGGKGDELQFFCHGSVFFPQDTTNSVHILIRRRGRRDRIPAGRGSGVRFPEFPQCLPSRFSGCLPDFPDILLRNAGRLRPAMRRRPFRRTGRGVLRCVPPRQFDVGNL